MKIKTLNQSIVYILILFLGIGLSACKKNGSSSGSTIDPQINSISPENGPVGADVTISGSDFSSTANELGVYFNGTAAQINSSTTSSISTTVPDGATSGVVSVITNDVEVTGPVFTVEAGEPVITSVDTLDGRFGDTVTITGLNFSDVPNENKVTFNGEGAFVTNATDTELIVEVPKGAESGVIEVTVKGLTVTGPNFIYNYTVTASIIAGSGNGGSLNGMGENAEFNNPYGLTINNAGEIFVTDYHNNNIRKIESQSIVSTYAGPVSNRNTGYVNGTLTEARFNKPTDIIYTSSDTLFIADYGNHSIRSITPNEEVITYAGTDTEGYQDGDLVSARFRGPRAMEMDSEGNFYISDSGNHLIRKVSQSGIVSTYAGSGTEGFQDGTSGTASFSNPWGMAFDEEGSLLVCDFGSHSIRRISASGEVSTIVGTGSRGSLDGELESASLDKPRDIIVDENGIIFISTFRSIRMIKDGVISTLYDNDDAVTSDTELTNAADMVLDAEGALIVANSSNDRILKIVYE